jgi:hypothetical protein
MRRGWVRRRRLWEAGAAGQAAVLLGGGQRRGRAKRGKSRRKTKMNLG